MRGLWLVSAPLFRQARSCMPLTAGLPLEPPGVHSHIPLSACFAPTFIGCVHPGVHVLAGWGTCQPLPPQPTQSTQVAVEPVSLSLSALSSPPESARAHTHSES